MSATIHAVLSGPSMEPPPPLAPWGPPLVLRIDGRPVSFRSDGMGLAILGPADGEEPEDSERARRTAAVMEEWVGAAGPFGAVDLPLLLCSLVEAHMVVGVRHPVVALAGHFARSETTEQVASGLFRYGQGVELATTTRPMRCVGAEVHGFLWVTDGWVIVQAGALRPSAAGPQGQPEIPVLEAS